MPPRDRAQPRALAPTERQAILDALDSPRFADLASGEAWAILLDEGTYLGSQSTFYRLLRRAGEARERRRHAVHPAAVKPELLATGPNQVWSWGRSIKFSAASRATLLVRAVDGFRHGQAEPASPPASRWQA